MDGRWRQKRLYKRQPQPASQSHYQRHQHRIILASIRLAKRAACKPKDIPLFSVSSRRPGPGMA
jgi:hypothetical protein